MVLAPALTGAFLLHQSRSGSGDLPSSSQRRHIPPRERSNFGLRFAGESIEPVQDRAAVSSKLGVAHGHAARWNLLTFCYRDLKRR